jgi:hypothetical protein
MSRRTNTWNGYESSLASALLAGATSVLVDSAIGLVAPLYLVVDPDVPEKREWILINIINGNSLENIVRDQQGSVGNIDHDAGAKVRAVFTKQFQDDVFDDIEDIESSVIVHVQDAGDPHSAAGYMKQSQADVRYVQLSGAEAMTGPLTLSADPTADLHAATKQYVDGSGRETLVFTMTGDLEVRDGKGRFLTQYDCTVSGVQATVDAAPAGADVAVTVNVGAGDVATVIPDGSQDGPADSASLSAPAGTLITVSVTQIGSSAPGSDLTVMIVLEAA